MPQQQSPLTESAGRRFEIRRMSASGLGASLASTGTIYDADAFGTAA